MTSRRVYPRPRGLLDVLRRGNLGALVLPLLLLAMGAAARGRLARKTVLYQWRGVQLAHPAGWTVVEGSTDPGEGDTIVLMDLLGPGRIKPRVTLRMATVAPAAAEAGAANADAPGASGDGPAAAGDAPTATGADDVAPNAQLEVAPPPVAPLSPALTATLSNRLPLYYVIGDQPMQVGSLSATRVESAFAFTPRTPPGRKAVAGRKGDIPVVMRAIDVVLLRGNDALSVQVAAPIEDFETQRPVLEAIIASVKLDPAAAPSGQDEAAAPAVASAAEPPTVPAAANDSDAPAGAGATALTGTEGVAAPVTVAGQVIDAESGLAVPGAIIVFLSPGTTVDNVNDDNLTQSAYTTGLADSTGHFASNRGLARPGHYGVMVVADGYRWIGTDDGVAVAEQTPSPMNIGVVPLRRR